MEVTRVISRMSMMTDDIPVCIIKNVFSDNATYFCDCTAIYEKIQGTALNIANSQTDGRRKIVAGSGGNTGINNISSFLFDLIASLNEKNAKHDKVYLSEVSILVSLPKYELQKYHFNFPCAEQSKKSYFVIVAIEDDTYLNAYLNSRSRRLKLMRGDLLIGRGDLHHAGSAYSNRNIRLHYYVDGLKSGRIQNTTYYEDDLTPYHKFYCKIRQNIIRCNEKRKSRCKKAADFVLAMREAKRKIRLK